MFDISWDPSHKHLAFNTSKKFSQWSVLNILSDSPNGMSSSNPCIPVLTRKILRNLILWESRVKINKEECNKKRHIITATQIWLNQWFHIVSQNRIQSSIFLLMSNFIKKNARRQTLVQMMHTRIKSSLNKWEKIYTVQLKGRSSYPNRI